jgi:hypothetical protein
MVGSRIAGYLDRELVCEIAKYHRRRVREFKKNYVRRAFEKRVDRRVPTFTSSLQLVLEAGLSEARKAVRFSSNRGSPAKRTRLDG